MVVQKYSSSLQSNFIKSSIRGQAAKLGVDVTICKPSHGPSVTGVCVDVYILHNVLYNYTRHMNLCSIHKAVLFSR